MRPINNLTAPKVSIFIKAIKASYNFIQEPMKSIHEEPSHADYETAWKCFADVVKIIKPNICIFIGLRNKKGINILDEINVKHSIRYFDTKVNN